MKTLARPLVLFLTLTTAAAFSQAQWRLAAGTANTPISAIDIYRSNPDTMYALGKKLFKSTNNGESWDTVATRILSSGSLEALRVDPFDARLLYVSHWGLGPYGNDVHMSANGGLTWRFLFMGSYFPADVIELSPRDHRTVYVGEGPGAIWRSTDQGNQWSRLPYGPIVALTSLVIDPVNDSILYAGHMFGTVLKSSDWGTTWQYSLNLNSGGMTRLAINPVDPRIIYATVIGPASGDGVYKTTDAGISWVTANNGLGPENRSIMTIAINPENPLELIIGMGVPTILFRTTNGGDLWVPFDSGLPSTLGHAECVAFDTLNDKVFVGVLSSNGSGLYVWDRTTSVETNEDVPTFFTLHQNYPNPFNPVTMICFEIPQSDHVSLRVFDMLGREVATLVDDQRDAGNYEEAFDASRLASGVYFYRLQTGSLSDVKKLIVLR